MLCGFTLIVSVAGARPDCALRTTDEVPPPPAFAAKVILPPPRFRIWTEAVVIVRVHVSREKTTFVELTSRIGTFDNCPTGMTVMPEVDVANKFTPSVDAMIFVEIFSGNRNPSCGVKLEDRKICNTLVTVPGVTVGVIVGVVGVFWGLFEFRGLIGG